jgi:peptide-methionine (R)-S-oxide reductase
MSAFDLTPPSPTQRQQLIDSLNSEERRVLLEHGTEAAFCGVFLDNKLEGVYTFRCSAPAPSSIPAPAGPVSSSPTTMRM